MNDMNDTPTPMTDAAYTQRPNEGAWDFKVRQEKTMESLERELTTAREELKAVTEQRNKLAELSGFGEFDKPIFP